MQENETPEIQQEEPNVPNDSPTARVATPHPLETGVLSQVGTGTCRTCNPNRGANGTERPNFVYVLGRVTARFPSQSVEKEYRQAINTILNPDTQKRRIMSAWEAKATEANEIVQKAKQAEAEAKKQEDALKNDKEAKETDKELAKLKVEKAVRRSKTAEDNEAIMKTMVRDRGKMDPIELFQRPENETLKVVLGLPENWYLARQMCWVLTVEEVETYILQPRDPGDLILLCESLRDGPLPTDIDVVIGIRGPIAPPEMCNGLMLPILTFDQLYSFSLDALITSLPEYKEYEDKKKVVQATRYKNAATGLFHKIKQMSDNAGATDEYRALNYLTVRDPLIYEKLWDKNNEGLLLTDVQVRPSRLSGTRKVADVIFTYTAKRTGVTEKKIVRVDVTEEFPFITSPLSPYYVYDQYP